MKFEMYFENYTVELDANYEVLFKKIAKETFKLLNLNDKVELSVSVVDAKKIRKYNREYRKMDKVTDVLSFAFNDFDDNIVSSNRVKMLGDIIICYQQAIKQANDYQHSLRREMAFLFIHGLLHLLGYDHINLEDEKKMFEIQDLVLNNLKIRKE